MPSSSRRADLVGLLFVVLAFLVALWLYPRLPYRVPVHWSLSGRVNGTMNKPWGVFLVPLLMLLLWFVFLVLPAISPKGFRMDGFLGTPYDVVRLSVLGFLFLLTTVALLKAAGYPLPVVSIVNSLIGVLLVILGNFMTKFRKNFFVGIRTPWTLANDEVWLRTHRLGARVFMIGGLLIILEGLTAAYLILPTLVVTGGIPVVWSYVLYRRIGSQDSRTRD